MRSLETYARQARKGAQLAVALAISSGFGSEQVDAQSLRPPAGVVRVATVAARSTPATSGLEGGLPARVSSVQEASTSATDDGPDLAAPRLFALAKMYAGAGEMAKALEHFEQAIAADPDAPFLRLEFAEFLVSFNRVGDAAREIERARALAPRSADVLRAYGQIQLSLGRTDKASVERALEAFEVLREVAPYDVQGMVTLGQIYQGYGRNAEAVEVFEELLRLHTDNRQLKRLLIDGLQRAGMTERAEELLQELLELEQESLESRLSLAELESNKGNHSAAIDLLENAGPAGEDSPELRAFLAAEHFRRANTPRLTAVQRSADLARALELLEPLVGPSSSTEILLLQAQVLAVSGQGEPAIDALVDLRRRRPDDPRAVELLAGILESEQRLDEAQSLLREMVARAETEKDNEAELGWLQNLIRVEARRENWQQVVELSERIRTRAEGELADRALGWQINALRQMGKQERALELVRKAEKRQGTSPSLLVKRAELLIELERRAQALEVLQSGPLRTADASTSFQVADLLIKLDREPSAFEVVARAVPAEAPFQLQVAAGEFFLRSRLFDRSVAFLERALDSEESRVDSNLEADLHFYLGQAHERSGRLEQATENFRRVLDLRADDTPAMNYLGYMWAEKGENLEEALGLVERAVELEPENGSYIDSLGWAQYRMGRYQDARANLERAAELTPDNPTILEHLGDVYLALGESESARASYQRALEAADETDPDDNLDQVRDKLRRLRESNSR